VFRQGRRWSGLSLSMSWGLQGFEAIEAGDSMRALNCIRVPDNKFTTQTALNLELNTIRLMQQGRGQVEAIVPSGTLADYLDNQTFDHRTKTGG
jgi:hypothetical protein